MFIKNLPDDNAQYASLVMEEEGGLQWFIKFEAEYDGSTGRMKSTCDGWSMFFEEKDSSPRRLLLVQDDERHSCESLPCNCEVEYYAKQNCANSDVLDNDEFRSFRKVVCASHSSIMPTLANASTMPTPANKIDHACDFDV